MPFDSVIYSFYQAFTMCQRSCQVLGRHRWEAVFIDKEILVQVSSQVKWEGFWNKEAQVENQGWLLPQVAGSWGHPEQLPSILCLSPQNIDNKWWGRGGKPFERKHQDTEVMMKNLCSECLYQQKAGLEACVRIHRWYDTLWRWGSMC
jgi:hypothetical protein